MIWNWLTNYLTATLYTYDSLDTNQCYKHKMMITKKRTSLVYVLGRGIMIEIVVSDKSDFQIDYNIE